MSWIMIFLIAQAIVTFCSLIAVEVRISSLYREANFLRIKILKAERQVELARFTAYKNARSKED